MSPKSVICNSKLLSTYTPTLTPTEREHLACWLDAARSIYSFPDPSPIEKELLTQLFHLAHTAASSLPPITSPDAGALMYDKAPTMLLLFALQQMLLEQTLTPLILTQKPTPTDPLTPRPDSLDTEP